MESTYSAEEIRVIGSLVEKEMATPEYYPLTLNALVNACNQKTNRSPVVAYDEGTVLEVLARLKDKRMVWQSSTGRVPRYEQFFVKNNNLINSEAAVLCVLMVRGPQTTGEIKAHSERLYEFADLDKVGETLADLIGRGYVVQLPRRPGQKEPRFAHLLGGEPDGSEEERTAGRSESTVPAAEQDARLALIEEELKSLRQEFDEFRRRVRAHMEQFE